MAALTKGLQHLGGICLVLAYAWICDRSGDTFGLQSRSKTFEWHVAACATAFVVLSLVGTFQAQGKGGGFLGNAQTVGAGKLRGTEGRG